MNKHIRSMKEAIFHYNAVVEDAREKISRNNEYYKPDVAENANKKELERIAKAREQAITEIQAAREAGRADVSKWADVKGAEITDDAKLLDYGITPEQFSALVGKYQNNATMLNVLKRYADAQNEKARSKNGGIMEYTAFYDANTIPTADAKNAAFDVFERSALDIINRLSKPEGSYFGGAGSEMVKSAITTFGEPSAFNAKYLDIIE